MASILHRSNLTMHVTQEDPMRTMLENFLMLGQPTAPDSPVWALLLAPLLVAAVVLRRTPRD